MVFFFDNVLNLFANAIAVVVCVGEYDESWVSVKVTLNIIMVYWPLKNWNCLHLEEHTDKFLVELKVDRSHVKDWMVFNTLYWEPFVAFNYSPWVFLRFCHLCRIVEPRLLDRERNN